MTARHVPAVVDVVLVGRRGVVLVVLVDVVVVLGGAVTVVVVVVVAVGVLLTPVLGAARGDSGIPASRSCWDFTSVCRCSSAT